MGVTLYEDLEKLHTKTDILPVNGCDSWFAGAGELKVLSMNVRSIHRNMDELLIFLESTKLYPDILVLSEAWLSDCTVIPPLNDYTSFQTTIHQNRSEGIVVYVKSILNPISKPVNIRDTNALRIVCQNKISLLALYRSPSHYDPMPFVESLYEEINGENDCKHSIIAGDINLDLLETNYAIERYMCVLTESGYISLINEPTRETLRTATCIDHIFVKSPTRSRSAIINAAITDHYICLAGIQKSSSMPKNNLKIIYTTNYREMEKELRMTKWMEILDTKDPNSATEKFVEKLQVCINTHTQKREIPHSKIRLKPWITEALVKSIRKRDALHMKVKKFPNNETLVKYYSQYKKICHRIIKSTRAEYYRAKIEENNYDSKTMWKIAKENVYGRTKMVEIKSLRLQDGSVDEPTQIAEGLNEYFSTVGSKLAEKIKNNLGDQNENGEDCDKTDTETILDLAPKFKIKNIEQKDITNIITSLRMDCAAGPDGVPTKLLKKCTEHLVIPLTYIINLSIDKCLFPEHLKKAYIIPIHKNGDTEDPQNYRPISLLNSISKIFEKAINNQFMEFLEKNNLLTTSQYGFRRGRNTNDAIVELTKLVTEALDKKDKCIAIFLDLAKAFDSVCHRSLL
jgi:hypothetical protein